MFPPNPHDKRSPPRDAIASSEGDISHAGPLEPFYQQHQQPVLRPFSPSLRWGVLDKMVSSSGKHELDTVLSRAADHFPFAAKALQCISWRVWHCRSSTARWKSYPLLSTHGEASPEVATMLCDRRQVSWGLACLGRWRSSLWLSWLLQALS